MFERSENRNFFTFRLKCNQQYPSIVQILKFFHACRANRNAYQHVKLRKDFYKDFRNECGIERVK